jgi:hypothetical protein
MVSFIDMAEGIAQRKSCAIAFPFLEVVRVEWNVISPLIHKTNLRSFQKEERCTIAICNRQAIAHPKIQENNISQLLAA